ncbi:hypothetical protein [[Enterobacter] lignolyticus]|nr:hypothetical protein [[Enterobacter] lignolyticus]
MEMIENIGITPEIVQAQEALSVYKGAPRVNLVIIDNINDSCMNKTNALKYQCRTLEKYTNFNRIYYISDSITSTNSSHVVYSTYSDFYDNIVSRLPPKIEYFVFIGLNFFFLRETNVNHFINEHRSAITYVKKQIADNDTLQDIFNSIYDDFKYNFKPTENYCCVDNTLLNQYHQLLSKINHLDTYIFTFLPIINAANSYGSNCIETKIQFANLSGGYYEKFMWIQTVHGSERCPLAVTFNKLNDDTEGYIEFLDSITPHSSRLEEEIFVNVTTNVLVSNT